MADFSQLHHRIWTNQDFTNLTTHAQLLYLTCLSHPTITQAGVLHWHPGRLAQLSPTWTKQTIKTAGQELQQHNFLIIDEDTDEAFIRSYYRNDGILKQQNLATSAARAIQKVASRTIHHHITHELHRLHKEHPNLTGFNSPELRQYMADNPDPQETKNHPFHPTIDPNDGPPNDPQIHPPIDPQPHPSNGGSNGGSPTPIHHSPINSWVTEDSNPLGSAGTGASPDDDDPDSVHAATPASRRGLSLVAVDGQEVAAGGSELALSAGELAQLAADREKLGRLGRSGGWCETHEGLPDGEVPPCGACLRERELVQNRVKFALKRVSDARRGGVGTCTLCDEFGFVKSAKLERGEFIRCDHGLDLPA